MTILFPSWLFGYAGPQDLLDPPLKEPEKSLPAVALHHYSTPGISPPSARVDAKYKRQPRRPPRLWEWWKYGVFVATKGPSHGTLPQSTRLTFLSCFSNRGHHRDHCPPCPWTTPQDVGNRNDHRHQSCQRHCSS
jgi:hypothetical protein